MIDELRTNIKSQIKIIGEIGRLLNSVENKTGEDRKTIEKAINSMTSVFKTANDSIEDLVNNIDVPKKINPKKTNFERVYLDVLEKSGLGSILLKKNDKEKLLKELKISSDLLKRVKNIEPEKKNEQAYYQPVRGYLKFSNKLFLNKSSEMIAGGRFADLRDDLRKSNMDILLETYVAMMFLTSIIAFIASSFLFVFLIFFDINFIGFSIGLYDGSIVRRILTLIWIPFILPVVCFYLLYIYPSTERDSIEKKVNTELPFAVIHMSSISGSGISPQEIFKIIARSNEYPTLGKEIKKVLNQINVYGYDLVTAITNVSKSTPSKKLAELFAGMSSTVNSGGDLSEFFEKRAESLMIDYRLEREKFSKLAETFMDIYISIVIAAPMIFMLLLVMINLTGYSLGGITTEGMTLIIITSLAIMNVIFLGFLQVKQPSY